MFSVAKVEPRQVKITTRLASQGAMLEELLTLIPIIKPETAREDARLAILKGNILQRPNLGSRNKLFKKLSIRYFPAESPHAVTHFVRALQYTSDPMEICLLAYIMLLWNDALVFLLGYEWLASKLHSLPASAETSDIERELDRLSRQVPEIRKWAAKTRRSIACHYLGLLRDCGFATGSARKDLKRPFISPHIVLFGAQLVIGSGEPATKIHDHPLFAAMGLSIKDVVSSLAELRQQQKVEFAVQGGVTHFAIREG